EFVETKTDDKGNTKHIYKKKTTPTPAVVTEYVDEDGKTIAPKEDGTQPNKDIEGYEFVETKTDDKGNTKHIYKKKTTPTPAVVTEYVDEDGKTIAPKENGTQPNKDIDDYEFVRTETDDKGNTKHIYKKKTTPTPAVVTEYVDEDGNPIYLEEKGKHDKKDIPNYEYVKTYTDKDGNTVHVYRLKQNPTTSVETRYVDENGFEISGTLVGRNSSKAIPGYEILRTEIDSNGNIIYVYRRKASDSQKVTKYLDKNGNEISKSTKGDNPKKDIDGYEFVRTETDANGNTIYIYKKKTTSPTTDVVTEYVDENGNTIATKVNGTKPNKDIKGYEFVRTETDANGNTIYIYKKKTTSPTTDVVTEYVDEDGNTIAPKTSITGINDAVILAFGSAIALLKIRKYKSYNIRKK
ncbi:MucBP domain-containing protein, partial [uncultured Peptoniphilus sp.]|uniref:MucBP domain-containing protein n=1 Tax=uncultured Peptoniphilus sp. TaxID=254354 RepID=UPI0025FA5F66